MPYDFAVSADQYDDYADASLLAHFVPLKIFALDAFAKGVHLGQCVQLDHCAQSDCYARCDSSDFASRDAAELPDFPVPAPFCEMKQDGVCAHASDRVVFPAESVAGFHVDRADVRAIAFLSAYLVFPADHGENLLPNAQKYAPVFAMIRYVGHLRRLNFSMNFFLFPLHRQPEFQRCDDGEVGDVYPLERLLHFGLALPHVLSVQQAYPLQ